MADYTFQKQIARALLSAGSEEIDLQSQPPVAAMAAELMAAPKPPPICVSCGAGSKTGTYQPCSERL